MNSSYYFLFFLFFLCKAGVSQTANTSPKYIKVENGYQVVLRQGDSLFKELEILFAKEAIPFASFTGLGFVNIEFGFFNAKTKKYKSKKINNVELAALVGSIAWQNGKPSIHAHGIGGDEKFRCQAGHILSAVVSTGSLEIMITVHEKKLERVKDEKLGANILELVD